MDNQQIEMPVSLPSTNQPMSNVIGNIEVVDPACFSPGFHNEVLSFSLSCALLILGIFYITYGYRHLKTSMFFMGFSLASCIVYLMCIQEEVMPEYLDILVSLGAGLLLGMITTLCQYLGLFITGFEGGIFLGISSLAIYNNLFGKGDPITYWEAVLVLFFFGVVAACFNLHYKKGLAIFSTSLIGGALTALSLDFFIHGWATLKWIGGRVRLETVVTPPCSYSWLILAMWPICTILGLFIQWALTGTGIRHQQSLAAQKRQRAPPVHRTPQQRAEMRQKKFRYLYQVRTAHGDVISQSYVQALQQKHSTPDPWLAGAECSTLQSDSTHLTVLAADPPNLDSDEDNARVCQ